MKTFISLIVLYWVALPSHAQEWVTLNPTRSGKYLTLPCEGEGPSMDLAVNSAIKQCASMASDQIFGDFHVESLSLSTQHSSGFHEEVSVDRQVKGLVCSIQRQQIMVLDNAYKAQIVCQFDTSTASLGDRKDRVEDSKLARNKDIVLSVVPTCDDILILGAHPRIILCLDNPVLVAIEANDSEIVVRRSGYLPKHIAAKDLFPTKFSNRMDVYLEKN